MGCDPSRFCYDWEEVTTVKHIKVVFSFGMCTYS